MAIRNLVGEYGQRTVETITQMIEGWPLDKKFGWEPVRSQIAVVLNIKLPDVWARQQLEKYEVIKDAYNDKRKKIRASKKKRKGKAGGEELSHRERTLQERIGALETEKLRLQKENHSLHEKFERWLYNAYCKGVSETVLDQALPVPSKEVKRGKGKQKRI